MAYPELEDPTGLGGFSSGLKTLGQILMPDPSKAAQAVYYGANTRKVSTEAAALANQEYMKMRLLAAQPGSGVAPFSGGYTSTTLPGAGPGAFPIYAPNQSYTPASTPQYPPP